MTEIIDPGGQGYEIEDIYVAVVVHDSGDESILSAGPGGELPLVSSNLQTLVDLQHLYADVEQKTGKPVKIVRFTKVGDAWPKTPPSAAA